MYARANNELLFDFGAYAFARLWPDDWSVMNNVKDGVLYGNRIHPCQIRFYEPAHLLLFAFGGTRCESVRLAVRLEVCEILLKMRLLLPPTNLPLFIAIVCVDFVITRHCYCCRLMRRSPSYAGKPYTGKCAIVTRAYKRIE